MTRQQHIVWQFIITITVISMTVLGALVERDELDRGTGADTILRTKLRITTRK